MRTLFGRPILALSTLHLHLIGPGLLLLQLCASSPLHASVAPDPASVARDESSGYNFVGAWSGSSSYNVNDVVSYGSSLYINTVATAPLTTTTTTPGSATNLFDPTAIVQDQIIVEATGTLGSAGGFQTSGFINVAGSASFVTNITIDLYAPWGIAFYDNNHNYVSGTYLNGNGYVAAGTPIPVPSGATYVRFWWLYLGGGMGTTLNAAVVNTGTVLQSTYTPYGSGGSGSTTTTTTPSAAPTDTSHWAVFTTTSAPTTPTTVTGPWAGKKMFILSDSIVWENPSIAGVVAATIGAVPSSQGATAPGIDAFPGRAFDGFANGQSSTGAYLPLSAAVVADVDLMVIALGTNQDSSAGLGSVTDSPSLSGTMSAQMRAMLEAIMGFKPGMRIVVVGPYQTNRYNVPAGTDGLLGTADAALSMANAQSIAVLKNINTAMKAVCQLYAIPYVDMYDESGVNFTTSALWLKDGLHPNPLGYSTFYAPYIASQLAHYAE